MKQRSGRELRWCTLDQWHMAGAWVQFSFCHQSIVSKSSPSYRKIPKGPLDWETRHPSLLFIYLSFIKKVDGTLHVPFFICSFLIANMFCCYQLFEMVVSRFIICMRSVASVVRDGHKNQDDVMCLVDVFIIIFYIYLSRNDKWLLTFCLLLLHFITF